MPRLTAQTLYKLEAQRSTRQRLIAVDELLILAYVLDVAPVYLIAGLDDDVPLPVSPDWSVSARGARMWIRGMTPLEGGDKRLYDATVPSSEENTHWFAINDITSYEQVLHALEGLKAFVSLQEHIANQPIPLEEALHQPVAAAIVTSPLGLLVGRRNDRTPEWGFITGEIEPGESPADAAVREVKEETGLRVEAGEVIGERDHPKTGRHMIYMAAAPTHGTDVFVGDEDELAEVRWVSLAEADELLPGMFAPVREYLERELGEG
jgi:8-oxo-dGTP pyrophosphatase MutT (NUDIX family)